MLPFVGHPADPPMYYIQNRGYCGNCMFWWRPDGNGYTLDLNTAGRFTRDEAERIVRGRPDVDKAWLCSDVHKAVKLHVSIEDFRQVDCLPLNCVEDRG